MKTTSLIKAPVGYVKYVIEPNREGYIEVMGLPVGDITLQALIDGMKKGLKDAQDKNDHLEQAIAKMEERINGLASENESLKQDIKNLKVLKVV